jgi:prepilin peptidase CpaA
MNFRALLIVLVGLAAVIEDLGWRRISNWTSGGALAAGLVVNGVQKGWMGALHSLIGAAIGFGIFLIFYVLGGMGGGDVKLMAGFGALLGDTQMILRAALWAALSGALIAVGFLAVRWVIRRSRVWLGNAPEPAGGRDSGKAGKSEEFIPYAPAITIGAWLALVSDL